MHLTDSGEPVPTAEVRNRPEGQSGRAIIHPFSEDEIRKFEIADIGVLTSGTAPRLRHIRAHSGSIKLHPLVTAHRVLIARCGKTSTRPSRSDSTDG
eukprot:351373-Chlamydomonas_euryale.AAC.2